MKKMIFGADYYPEQWDRSYWIHDAEQMKEMGISAIRIMEFAWTLIEPKKGKYDFSLFDEIIEIFAARGIKTVLGTPTATVPAWLFEQETNIFQTYIDGTARDFGTRRQACYNSKKYFSAAMKIADECAKHFGNNKNVIGWQIDNEIGHEGSDLCVCDNCVSAWHEWLEKKYKTTAAMNEEWGAVFWSTAYSKFSQVPVPKPQVMSIHNPGLILDYYRFCSDAAVKFCTAQRDILKKNISTGQWVTTDIFSPSMSCVIDFAEMLKPLDMTGMNNYPVWGDQNEPLPYIFSAYNLAYYRGLKEKDKFTVFEQISGFQGHQCLGYHPPEGQMLAWTHQAAAHGADKIFYFRWRTAPFGQEQLCHGILDADDALNDRFYALKENIWSRSADYDLIASSSLDAAACLVQDKDNIRILRDNYLTKNLYNSPVKFMQVGYESETAKFFAPFSIFNVNCDVKAADSIDLNRYKIISLPLYQMADPEFVARLEKWVSAGGCLVLGWRAGARDMRNHSSREQLPGIFTSLAGIKIKKFESLNETKVKIKIGIIPAKGESWADVIEPVTAQIIARYSDKKKHYRGMPAVTKNSYGRGTVFYLGTTPDPAGIFFIYRKIFKSAGIRTSFHGFGIESLAMTSPEGKKFKVVINHTPDKKFASFRILNPWEMRIIHAKQK